MSTNTNSYKPFWKTSYVTPLYQSKGRIVFAYNAFEWFEKLYECCVLQKQLMVSIKSLCIGTSGLSKSDVVTFVALLKAAKIPPGLKPGEGTGEINIVNDMCVCVCHIMK